MTDSTSPEDLPMDEYLRAALRHAPDHALTPPSGVSQAILAAARQVHRPAPAPPEPVPVRVPVPRRTLWRERLQLLLSPRWAGSLATALVGALVLGLWFDQDLPEPTARPDGPSSKAVERQEAAPATPAATKPAPVETAPHSPVQHAMGDAAAVAPRKPDAPAVAPAPAPPSLKKAPRADIAPTGRAGAMREPPTDSPKTARASVEASRAAAAARRRTEPQAAPSATGIVAAPEVAVGSKQTLSQGAATAPGVAAAPGAASPALTLWRRAVAESSARAAIWTWQPADAPSPRSFDADGQAWLLRLVQAARGRWTDVAERSDGAAAAEVRWWRDDQTIARLRIEAQGLRWLEPSGRIRFAPMDADALARLREF
jgi:hypothetical protein